MHPRERIAEWQALANAGAFVDLADGLMQSHYDPRYDKHRARMAAPLVEVSADRLHGTDLPDLARRVAGAVAALRG
jgi:tRNA 2-selenouridine synthase